MRCTISMNEGSLFI
ncbi:BgTH12-04663 [Blumeria graminis f. sp. triticale]|uniref:BgTH12-04663 n=1 Tax=Blumeria graminis f. sp. triticale TaxID=1689686 RepID=A0A9W4CV01_BLUGR|nr:BgTH12-04663 [Blumeria graminis f. sp. triticale]